MNFSPALQRRSLLIVSILAVSAYYLRFIKEPGGLKAYPAAAQCMLHGITPLHCGLDKSAYHPIVALLAVPLLVMPMWLREIFWYLVLVGTLFASLRLCENFVRRLFPGEWTERELAYFRILTFICSLKFILAVLENQAYDSIALILILLGLLALLSERYLLAGATLATAAALKVTPLIFLPYLLVKRRFAAAATFVGVYVFITLLPDIVLPPKESWHSIIWVREVLLGPFLGGQTKLDYAFWLDDNPMYQSLRPALARILGVGGRSTQQFETALHIVTGLYILGASATILKSMNNDRLIAVDGALLIVSGLLLSPVSSQSHFVGLMLPYSILAAVLVKDRATRVFNAVGLLASFILLTATSNDLVGRNFTGWALWHSLPVLGTLTLAVQLGVLIWLPGVWRAKSPRTDLIVEHE